MRLIKGYLTPNQTRIGYDGVMAGLTAVLAFAYGYFFLSTPPGFEFLLLPPLLIFFNGAFGIYSRFKVSSGRIKAIVLGASVVCTAVFPYLISGNLAPICLWALLIMGPLALPRIFLNLKTRVKTDFLTTAIKNRGPVLVVGGGGYIGSHVVAELLAADMSVRVLDRLVYSKEPLKEFASNSKFELIEGDATDIVKLVSAMQNVSAVVHLGGLVGDPACAVDEAYTRHTNVIATRMVKEVAISLGVSRFIFASSCSVYGSNDNEVSETSDLNPVSLYARTKIDSEKELLLCPDENFFVTILRFATVFGHSRRPRFDLVANLFTAQAMIDGRVTVTGENQWRPFVHVRDLARAVVLVLKAQPDRVRGQVFNVGDKRLNMTIGQVAECVKKVVSEEKPIEIAINNDVSDRRNYMVSFDKIKATLNFECATLMEAGVREIVAEFKRGNYKNYRDPAYSNLEMTKRAATDFQDPAQTTTLYRPLGEDFYSAKAAGSKT